MPVVLRRYLLAGVTPFLFLFLTFSSPAMADRSRVLAPDGWMAVPEWTSEEKQETIVKKFIRKTSSASYFWFRLKGAEKPHTHEQDLIVVMIEGQAVMHMGEKSFKLRKGDIIDIPRGALHWAESKGRKPVLVYGVFLE